MKRASFAFQIGLAVCVLASISACGRAGAPELPPTVVKTDPDPETGETQANDRSFVLDGLLN